jgi:hypothetical protein
VRTRCCPGCRRAPPPRKRSRRARCVPRRCVGCGSDDALLLTGSWWWRGARRARKCSRQAWGADQSHAEDWKHTRVGDGKHRGAEAQYDEQHAGRVSESRKVRDAGETKGSACTKCCLRKNTSAWGMSCTDGSQLDSTLAKKVRTASIPCFVRQHRRPPWEYGGSYLSPPLRLSHSFHYYSHTMLTRSAARALLTHQYVLFFGLRSRHA